MKPKVYFAKSNACDSNEIASVRSYLEKLNVEIVEHKKNFNYSIGPLIGSDYLVILPEVPDSYVTIIGRGLFSQIEEFKKKHKDWSKRIFFVSDIDYCGIDVCEFQHINIIDRNNWTTYAEVKIDMYSKRELNSTLFEIKEQKSKTSNTNKSTCEDLIDVFIETIKEDKPYETYIRSRKSFNDCVVDGTVIERISTISSTNDGGYMYEYRISGSPLPYGISNFLNRPEVSGHMHISTDSWTVVDAPNHIRNKNSEPLRKPSKSIDDIANEIFANKEIILPKPSVEIHKNAEEILKSSTESISTLPNVYLLLIG